MDGIAEDIFKKKANAVVTTGGIQSNHCRAVAVFCAQHNMDCSLVLHGSKDEFYKQSGNAKVMRLSGAEIIFVEEAKQISECMETEMDKFKGKGFNPYYIWGGGHMFEGACAYINAVSELRDYCIQQSWWPTYIFLASGTGSTQAGILAGLDKFGIHAQVIGISVGRKTKHAQPIVKDFYQKLCDQYSISYKAKASIVLDDYLCGGYSQFDSSIQELSERSLMEYGFTLDTCYTAKAFYGMQDFMAKSAIKPEEVLFWHTGGVFNFLAV